MRIWRLVTAVGEFIDHWIQPLTLLITLAAEWKLMYRFSFKYRPRVFHLRGCIRLSLAPPWNRACPCQSPLLSLAAEANVCILCGTHLRKIVTSYDFVMLMGEMCWAGVGGVEQGETRCLSETAIWLHEQRSLNRQYQQFINQRLPCVGIHRIVRLICPSRRYKLPGNIYLRSLSLRSIVACSSDCRVRWS